MCRSHFSRVHAFFFACAFIWRVWRKEALYSLAANPPTTINHYDQSRHTQAKSPRSRSSAFEMRRRILNPAGGWNGREKEYSPEPAISVLP
ncbi:hypothetical protein P167DRAFT_531119 [Morchella conica CCBAS932]|uniref:Secreted protein n=1 Tax=Morchella conica CCBAS932 TaxID=1392247 RepID=A0A3N4L3T9_9PEZI|nr:hypothetical protein P167DRAFT_531119 [Morchella conica CCBAS932]